MSFVKYRVKEVAADFGVTPKDIAEIVGKYFEKPRSNTQVLTDEQLNVVFDAITQKHQIASLEQVFAVALQAKSPSRRRQRPRSPQPSPHRAALRPQMPRLLRRAPTRPPSPSRSAQARTPRHRYQRRYRQRRPLRRPRGRASSPSARRISPAASRRSPARTKNKTKGGKNLRLKQRNEGAGEDAPPAPGGHQEDPADREDPR